MSLLTRFTPSVMLAEGDEFIATLLDIYELRAQRNKRAASKRKGG